MLHGPASYLGIFLFLVLTGCGLPIPEEVGVVTAGVLAGQGTLDPWLAFLACLAGCLIGDLAMYGIGARFGRTVLTGDAWWGRLISVERERQMEDALQRHGLKMLLAARFMVGVRAPIYIAAGVLRMPLRRFLAIDLICASAVVGSFFTLSFAFGPHVGTWIRRSQYGATAAVGLLVAAAAAYWAWQRSRQRGPQHSHSPHL